MNKRRFYGVVFFLLFMALLSILLPLGDEPDYEYRLGVVYDTFYSWFPFCLLPHMDANSSELVSAGAWSMWAKIFSNYSVAVVEYRLIRYFVTFIVCLPIIVLMLFGEVLYHAIPSLRKSYSMEEWKTRLDALMLSMLWPGVMYAIGVVGVEPLTLVLSFMFYLFMRVWWMAMLLYFGVLSFDAGNGIVLLVMCLGVRLLIWMHMVKKTIIFGVVAFGLLLIYFMRFDLLLFIGSIDLPILSSKALSILYSYGPQGVWSQVNDKYPVILRPAITFMSLVFMLPSGIKVVPAYILVVLCVLVSVYRCDGCCPLSNRLWSAEYGDLVSLAYTRLVGVIYSVIAVIFIVPGFSNGKYYVYAVLYLVNYLMHVLGFYRLIVFVFVLDFIVVLFLVFYRL